MKVNGDCVGVIVSEDWVLTHSECYGSIFSFNTSELLFSFISLSNSFTSCNAWEAELPPAYVDQVRKSYYVLAGHFEGQGKVKNYHRRIRNKKIITLHIETKGTVYSVTTC